MSSREMLDALKDINRQLAEILAAGDGREARFDMYPRKMYPEFQANIELLESQRVHLRYAAVCEVVQHINSELSVLDDRFEQERLECKARGFEYRKPPPRAEFGISNLVSLALVDNEEEGFHLLFIHQNRLEEHLDESELQALVDSIQVPNEDISIDMDPAMMIMKLMTLEASDYRRNKKAGPETYLCKLLLAAWGLGRARKVIEEAEERMKVSVSTADQRDRFGGLIPEFDAWKGSVV